jgi:DNA-binding LacI/PurR family transcriptional regulator
MVRAQPVTSESNLLSDTVVVLSLVAEGIHKIAGHKHEGWAEVIGDSAIAEARRNGFGALALLAKNCTEARLRGIALGNPVGFLVPELLGEETRILSILSSLPRRTVPIVVYGDARELDSFDRICSDAEEGAYLLTSSLIKRGARRILNFWTASPEKHDWAAKRLAGYRRAMQESGLDPLPVSVAATFPAHSLDVDVFDARTRYVAGYLFEHLRKSGGIDALMLTTDGEIPFTASACRICGMKPNEDVLLAGYDNYWLDLAPELLDREPCPPLATIDKRNAEIGRAMVTLLRDRRSGQLTEAPVSRSVAPVLVTDLVR